MKALQLCANEEEKINIVDIPLPTLEKGKVLVKIKAASLNHRDQWIREGKYPKIVAPSILGSDGCGVVEKVFDKEDEHWLGKEVIINPNVGVNDNSSIHSSHYSILGMPTQGTFAEYIAVNTDRLHLKPSHLSFEEAAAIPLAGLTAYRAVFTKGNIKAGDTVLVTGIGGGVAQFACQFAIAAGAKVYVTSSEEAKIEALKKLGAVGGVNYKLKDWYKTLLEQSQGFDTIIDSAGGESFNLLLRNLKPEGTLVFYGATLGSPTSLDMARIFFGQYTIKGTTMGNDDEFLDMLHFIEKNKIIPIIDSIRPFNEIIKAFDEMKLGKQFGKMIINL